MGRVQIEMSQLGLIPVRCFNEFWRSRTVGQRCLSRTP